MRSELQAVLRTLPDIPAEDLPRLLGELEEVRATAMMRLSSPAPLPKAEDRLLDIGEAAERLGLSKDYLYRHHGELTFTKRIGKKLLFSSLGIDAHIRKNKG
jgi:excisionase family DNA binding protein